MNIDMINEQLNILENTKTDIKQALINKGQDVDDNTPFSEYPAKIDDISISESIDSDDVLGGKLYQSLTFDAENTMYAANNLAEKMSNGEYSDAMLYELCMATNEISEMPQTLGCPLTYSIYIGNVAGPNYIEIWDENMSHNKYLFFSPNYTSIFIQLDAALGFGLVDLFLSRYPEETMESLRSLSGWYDVELIETNSFRLKSTDVIPEFNNLKMTKLLSTNLEAVLTTGGLDFVEVNFIQLSKLDGALLLTKFIDESNDYFDTNNKLNGYDIYRINSFPSVRIMNNAVGSILEGEIVEVTDYTNNNPPEYYIKETTMKKLVKEEDTISPTEYQQSEIIVEDILS